MKTELIPLEVQSVDRLTEDTVRVELDVPDDLQERFGFIPGQYLALETEIDGETVRRSYSLCSAPHEECWAVAIKKVEGGKFSTYANQVLQAGDVLKVMPPTGSFKLPVDADHQRHYVGFAAGSGITPIMSMVKSVMETEPDSRFTLFYGNRTVDSIIFRSEIEDLKNTYLERLSIHHILSREKLGSPLFYGRLDAEKCSKFASVFFDPSQVHGFYLCGPAQMIFAVKDQLIADGVKPEKVHFELFTTEGMPVVETTISEAPDYDPTEVSKVTVVLDGERMEMPLAYGGATVLEAALDAGVDLPYACKGGVCSTCKAKITDGEVEMELNYALEPDEIGAGFVLTCQAHPRTSSITVDFDEA